MWINDFREIGWTASLGVAIVAAFTVANLGAAHAPTEMSACVKKDTGQMRVLRANEGCKEGEWLLVWNVQVTR
jgi:hypothetical protein